MLGVNFSSGIFSAYLKSFGASEIIISVGAAALYITRGTSSIMIDKLSKMIPFKKIFIIAFIGSAVSTILFTIPHDPLTIAVLRTVQGVFSGLYWVLINIYAVSLGVKTFDKFKNLSSVTIFLNIGGFAGAVLSGKIASEYSAHTSFYIGTVILIIGAIICLYLKDIESKNTRSEEFTNAPLFDRERLILVIAVVSSCINAYINLGIPLFILHLGGSYKEIGTTTGMGILAAAAIVGASPWIKKKYSYSTIVKVNYLLITVNLFAVFYFKSILVIYFLQSILMGISALDRNIWYSVLHDNSKNYNKSIGLLRGVIDYYGAFLFIVYGYIIHVFGHYVVVSVIVITAIILTLIVSHLKQLQFLKKTKHLHIHGAAHFNHVLHRLHA